MIYTRIIKVYKTNYRLRAIKISNTLCTETYLKHNSLVENVLALI